MEYQRSGAGRARAGLARGVTGPEGTTVPLKHMEAQLVRLNAKIQAREAELSELKARRKELKARLTEVKRALKEGKAPPADAEPEGLAERIGAVLTENVIEPIVELIHPPSEEAKPAGG